MSIWAKVKDGYKVFYAPNGDIVCIFKKGMIADCDFNTNVYNVVCALEDKNLIEREEWKQNHLVIQSRLSPIMREIICE